MLLAFRREPRPFDAARRILERSANRDARFQVWLHLTHVTCQSIGPIVQNPACCRCARVCVFLYRLMANPTVSAAGWHFSSYYVCFGVSLSMSIASLP